MIDTETTIDIADYSQNSYRSNKYITITLEVHVDLDTKIITNEELHLDLHIDLHTKSTLITDTILDPDTDLVLNHKETPLNDTITHIDLHLDQEILHHDLEHLHKIDIKIE